LPLQRYIVDFAADVLFAEAQAKLLEQHGGKCPSAPFGRSLCHTPGVWVSGKCRRSSHSV
jgi:hypothetical protein